jgi:hypothetical protein
MSDELSEGIRERFSEEQCEESCQPGSQGSVYPPAGSVCGLHPTPSTIWETLLNPHPGNSICFALH